MEKYNVLITGTGGCGVGEGVYDALRFIDDYELFACNSSSNSLVLFNNPARSFIVPMAQEERYCEIIKKISIENGIRIIIPGSEQELLVLANNKQYFEMDGLIILANTPEVINTFNDKWETYKRLDHLGIKTPQTTLRIDDVSFFADNSFPFLIKPVIGNASKNVFIVNTQDELKCISKFLALKKIPFVIQQYIGTSKDEFTISVLSDFDGNYIGSIVLKRLLAGGFSQFVVCEEFKEVDTEARKIAAKVNSRGPLNIQCRIMNDELYVFEINPRFSGTTPFRALLGFNEPDVLIKKILHHKNIFDESLIKYQTFGVRGFKEEIYLNHFKSGIPDYH